MTCSARGLERVGPDAIVVRGERLELQVKKARDRLDAGIGDRLGEHDITGTRQRGQYHRGSVLRSTRHDDPGRVTLEPGAAYPRGARLAMPGHPGSGLIQID